MPSLIGDDIRKQFNPRKVGIVEFCESDEFCGKPLYPRQQVMMKLFFLEEMDGWEEDVLTEWINGGRYGEVEISPQIRERRDWLRDHGYKHFGQICLVGGRRSSKGHMTGLAIAKKIYEVQQIPDPGRHYGIDVDKAIYFSCVAAALHQAKTLQFADAYSAVTRCKALQPWLGKQLEEELTIKTEADKAYVEQMKREGMKPGKDWSKLRLKPLAANADTLRGYTTMVAVFDEMAFFQTGESSLTAEACYAALEPSLAQFGRDALIFCNSSPYSEAGEFYKQVQQALAVDVDGNPEFPMQMMFRYPSWELYRDWRRAPAGNFRKAILVSPDAPDEELNEEERVIKFGEQKKEKANPEAYRVERRAMWAATVDAYLNPLTVDRAFKDWNGKKIEANLSNPTYLYMPYMAHCDPSSTTAGFGFAIAHVESAPDDNFPDGVARHVVFDYVKRWNPKDFPGGTINYLTVEEELAMVMQMFLPEELTFDQFNSIGLIQGLNNRKARMNIPQVRIFSTDPTNAQNWERWECLKTCLNLGLVHIPPDCINENTTENYSDYLKQEMKFLVEKKTPSGKARVETNQVAPVKTKDIADCVREVVYKFLGTFIENYVNQAFSNARIAPGAERGYRIGGINEGGPMNPATGFDQFYAKRPGAGFVNPARGMGNRRRR